MLHKKVESCHTEEHEQGIGACILRETGVVGHEGERKGAGKSDGRKKLSCKEKDHGDGEGSEYQRNDSEVSFWLGERIE